jgi:hypothetical protein
MLNRTHIIPLLLILLMSCGKSSETETSETKNILTGNGWDTRDSPYMLLPGSTIAVCDTGVKAGVADLVVKAVRIWLDAGGRDARIRVIKGCSADRVVKLYPAPAGVSYYGQAHPLNGNVHRLDVPPQWAGHWTANHEVGHVFGFAHKFQGTVSIMNSEQNGRFMNGGNLSAYDLSEVRRMLSIPHFATVQAAWNAKGGAPTPTPKTGSSCLGANGVTMYPHTTVTTYQGNTYTCNDGKWDFSPGISSAPKSCVGANGVTIYSHNTVTTYQGNTYTCNNGKWDFSPGT